MPKEEPARDGLTNTGRPSRSFSSSVMVIPLRSTTYGPIGMPSAAQSFLVNSLSMAAAEAKTFAPTYGMSAISSIPWMVPSSPYAPCSTGKTTSTSARARGPCVGSSTIRPPAAGSARSTNSTPELEVISGSWRSWIASWSGSPLASTHWPCRVMPTGTTSNSSGSSAPSTLPALTQEMPCSGLRPPKTIATRVLPGVVTGGHLFVATAAGRARRWRSPG